MNKDGFDDVILGAPIADTNGKDLGASYVVFGRDFAEAVSLSANAAAASTNSPLSIADFLEETRLRMDGSAANAGEEVNCSIASAADGQWQRYEPDQTIDAASGP